jgi:hypothetical protein
MPPQRQRLVHTNSQGSLDLDGNLPKSFQVKKEEVWGSPQNGQL